ncbi:MAG: VTT domain-containing protein [Candidatus Blackburnbacteria bacterium]|nr:VTT domain-containing protein [Candidatus Blackburnbacteria bacterium]
MFTQIESLIISYSDKVPLEIFMFLGSIIEEVIAPLPSPFIPIAAGSVTALQGKPLSILLWLAAFGAMGKVLGAYVLYFAADKAEDIVIGKFGKIFGVTHKEIEGIGKHLNQGYRDIVVLTILRTLPIISSTLVSVVCGTIKVNKKTYITATLVGTYFRDLLFLYFGFIGLSTFGSLVRGLESTESKLQALAAGAILIFLVFLLFKRRKLKMFS